MEGSFIPRCDDLDRRGKKKVFKPEEGGENKCKRRGSRKRGPPDEKRGESNNHRRTEVLRVHVGARRKKKEDSTQKTPPFWGGEGSLVISFESMATDAVGESAAQMVLNNSLSIKGEKSLEKGNGKTQGKGFFSPPEVQT